MEVVNQPAGKADQLQKPDNAGVVNSQRDGGYEFGNQNENAEDAVPGEEGQQYKQNAKHDLINKITFALFVSIPIYHVGKAAGQTDAHTGVAAKKNVMDSTKQIVDVLVKHDQAVFSLLHADHDKRHADKAENLCQQILVEFEHTITPCAL